MYASIGGMAMITLAIGAGAGYAFDIAERAAGQLLDTGAYRDAVLGRAPESPVTFTSAEGVAR
jgi:hypothetical protein